MSSEMKCLMTRDKDGTRKLWTRDAEIDWSSREGKWNSRDILLAEGVDIDLRYDILENSAESLAPGTCAAVTVRKKEENRLTRTADTAMEYLEDIQIKLKDTEDPYQRLRESRAIAGTELLGTVRELYDLLGEYIELEENKL